MLWTWSRRRRRDRGRAFAAAGEAGLSGKFTSRGSPRFRACAASFERPAPAPARHSRPATACAHEHQSATHTRLPRYARGKSARSRRSSAAMFSRQRRDGVGRESAMALHGGVLWRANCGARKPTRRSESPSRRSSLIWTRRERNDRTQATPLPVCRRRFRPAARRGRPGVPRTLGGTGLCDGACALRRGLFTWPEWAAALGREIKRAQAAGDPDTGDTYYHHWLAALECLVAEKSIADAGQPRRYRDAWDHAADRTPHGTPIELEAGRFLIVAQAVEPSRTPPFR